MYIVRKICVALRCRLLSCVVLALYFFAKSNVAWTNDLQPPRASTLTSGQIRLFLEKNCVRCHGRKKHEANFRLDEIDFVFSIKHVAEKWVDVMDRLNLGEMPPKDEPRPDPAQQAKLIEWIVENVRAANQKKTGRKIVMRRLNRRQYNNTIRDLVGVDFQPASDFPDDPSAFGFDNVGSGLSMSPVHIEKFLGSARKIVGRALPNGPRPYVMKWHFEIDAAVNEPHYWLRQPDRHGQQIAIARLSTGINQKRDGFLVIRDTAWNTKVDVREFRVHRPGKYIVKVRAAGSIPDRTSVLRVAMRTHRGRLEKSISETESEDEKKRIRDYWKRTKEKRIAQHFQEDPIYDYGPPRLRVVLNETQALGAVDVTNQIDDPQIFEFPVFLEDADCNLRISNAYSIPSKLENSFLLKRRDFPRPELLVDWIKVEGPVFDDWPPKSKSLLLGPPNNKASDELRAQKVLALFMERAFRRPVGPDEVNPMLTLYLQARQRSNSFEKAIEVPIIAILSSPHFLYLVEPREAGRAPHSTTVHAYELASRLSYFLWQSMPDEELFELARTKRLSSPEELNTQVDRMLADPKAKSFIASFSRQWLGLQSAGAVRPDRRLYPNFDEHLLESMIGESENFFGEILKQNHSVLNFLKSDFTTLNERLARFYGIPGVMGEEFRSVSVGPETHRGGLLTQASIHMVTSNGTRTSPVKRGVWILQNLLGAPPPPPPPNAGDIQPGVPGIEKATVRDRLEAHRQNPACAACHDKIDPLGFALENFNAIGQWRDQEGFGYQGQVREHDPEIDNLGRLPNGEEFRGIHELQHLLLKDKDKFLRCLIEKLMIFALGRGMEYSDRPTIDQILSNAPTHGFSLRGLIKDIVNSKSFLTK